MDDHSPAQSPAPVETENAPAWAVPASSNGTLTPVKPGEPEIIVPSTMAASPAVTAFGSGDRIGSEQLARIEDKTSRIEEKFARSEAAMQRVVDRFDAASGRMSEVASQSELAAVRGEVAYIARRVRGIPGAAALAVTAVATAVLTALVLIAILKYVPGLAPPR